MCGEEPKNILAGYVKGSKVNFGFLFIIQLDLALAVPFPFPVLFVEKTFVSMSVKLDILSFLLILFT